MCLCVGGGSRRRSERDRPVMRASNIINISYNCITCNYNCNVFFLHIYLYKFKQCVFHKMLVLDFDVKCCC